MCSTLCGTGWSGRRGAGSPEALDRPVPHEEGFASSGLSVIYRAALKPPVPRLTTQMVIVHLLGPGSLGRASVR
jgi:hypothetical protein